MTVECLALSGALVALVTAKLALLLVDLLPSLRGRRDALKRLPEWAGAAARR